MSDEREYVYAIAHPHGYVKIGHSKNPQKRLTSHQISCPYELWILAQLPVKNPKDVEEALHERFDYARERGEWFDLDYDDYDVLVDMMRMAASQHEFDSLDEFYAWQERKREAML